MHCQRCLTTCIDLVWYYCEVSNRYISFRSLCSHDLRMLNVSYVLQTVVIIAPHLALSPAGNICNPTIGGFTCATIALVSYHYLQDLISANTHTNPHFRTREYNNNCTSQMNWFDLARTHCSRSEPESWNAFESIEGLLNNEVDDFILSAYFWEQSDIPSPWNTYRTEAAAHGGGLEPDDPVFGNSWTNYWGAHAWFNFDSELPCKCEGHNCLGTHSMEGHTPAGAETAKPAPVPLIVIETLTPTPSELGAYNWHW